MKVLAVLVLLVTLSGTAAAAEPEAHGWWWRAQTGLLTPLPPPPGAPEDGLVVSGAPDGPAAVAALRYEVDGPVLAATLALEVASDQGGAAAAMSACPSTERWLPARAGAWDARPGADCEAGQVAGQRSDGGEAWYFDVTTLLADGVLDVVLEPEPGAPFQIAFAPPGPDSLQVTTVSEPETFAAPPPPAGYEPPPAAFQQPVFPSVPQTGAAPHMGPGPAVPAPAPAAPEQPGGAVAAPAEPPSPAEPAADTAPTLGVLLVLAAFAALYLLQRRAPQATVGGLGRFARPRTAPPPPLY